MQMMYMKALIVYGTRGGSTKQIAEEMGKIFGEHGYAATVRNAKESGGIDVSDYDVIVAGRSVRALKWTRQATAFLKRNQKVLCGKKVALFWSGRAGDDPVDQGNVNRAMAKVTGAFPEIKPLRTAYFGSYTAFGSWNPVARIANNVMKKEFEKRGIDVSRPVDRRDWDAIRQWAADVAAEAKA
ncbi:MAG: protoporphyrinogen oxidase [Methanocella sp. PtaU1.Bin125]|nr:MAG: protoporphyrinogen oxidase [Methanocella sp. PtaU1.Bin125]